MKKRKASKRKEQLELFSHLLRNPELAEVITSDMLLNNLQKDPKKENYFIEGVEVVTNAMKGSPVVTRVVEPTFIEKMLMEDWPNTKYIFSIFHKPSRINYIAFWNDDHGYYVLRIKKKLTL